ncbi:hypothetical protein F751_2759 [Auxenochlorella protothecoides]|uniref:Uncharacterized protein n=1 Tax=Auxenochlorella protothecoides TaxID=3075 RepID=A0A087SPW4_AUXPR|nr:hypothetical protein F751_2759 [Auxenochlorella protothecoides]KFM27768.1 hypothetical protein F751_2759 [Auxenochlorella protothecoides]
MGGPATAGWETSTRPTTYSLRTSFPSMKAVGPRKGKECTGRADGMISTPTICAPFSSRSSWQQASMLACQPKSTWASEP